MRRKITAAFALLPLILGSVWTQADTVMGFQAYMDGDYQSALAIFSSAAEEGDAVGQYGLGAMYRDGDGVPQDYKAAVRWYTAAAEQGLALAQYDLGVMYSEGKGVPQSDKAAVRWYTPAAEQGLAKAQNNLAAMYGLGRGVPQDFVYAYMWSNIAASISGESATKSLRDIVARQMSKEQLAEAQRLTRECVKKYYQDC